MNTVRNQSVSSLVPHSTAITEYGSVVAVESEYLWVETVRQSSCNSCSAQKACGHGLLNKRSGGQCHRIRVLLTAVQQRHSFAIGDEVDLAIPERALVQGALIVYLLPLFSLLAGAVLVSQWWPDDVAAAIGASLGFAVGIAGVRLHAAINRDNQDFQPAVLTPQHKIPDIIHSV